MNKFVTKTIKRLSTTKNDCRQLCLMINVVLKRQSDAKIDRHALQINDNEVSKDPEQVAFERAVFRELAGSADD
jgi:hypothetical protein